jgi:hypothetical protein
MSHSTMHRRMFLKKAAVTTAATAWATPMIQTLRTRTAWAQVTPAPGAACRMTGGGKVFIGNQEVEIGGDEFMTHGFEIHCDRSPPNNLQVNWRQQGGGGTDRFHLEELTTASCIDDPTITPNPPRAFVDTFIGTGIGKYNGSDGATIQFRFTDAGEPGNADTATIVIQFASQEVLNVSAPLTQGDHQMHCP